MSEVRYEINWINGDRELDCPERGCIDDPANCDTHYEWPISKPTLAETLSELGEHLLWRPLTPDDVDWCQGDDAGVLAIAGIVDEHWHPLDEKGVAHVRSMGRKVFYALWRVVIRKVVGEPVLPEQVRKAMEATT